MECARTDTCRLVLIFLSHLSSLLRPGQVPGSPPPQSCLGCCHLQVGRLWGRRLEVSTPASGGLQDPVTFQGSSSRRGTPPAHVHDTCRSCAGAARLSRLWFDLGGDRRFRSSGDHLLAHPSQLIPQTTQTWSPKLLSLQLCNRSPGHQEHREYSSYFILVGKLMFIFFWYIVEFQCWICCRCSATWFRYI